MSHYVIIRRDEMPGFGRAGGQNVGTVAYKAKCKCGWLEKAHLPAEITERAQRHLIANKADVFAYDWRSE